MDYSDSKEHVIKVGVMSSGVSDQGLLPTPGCSPDTSLSEVVETPGARTAFGCSNPISTFSNNHFIEDKGMFLAGHFYSSGSHSFNSIYANLVEQFYVPNSLSPTCFDGLPCLLNVECQKTLFFGDTDVGKEVGVLEMLGNKYPIGEQGVDLFIENMGLKVADMKGETMLLSNYMEDPKEVLIEDSKKCATKGKKELRNLEWAINPVNIR